LVFMTAPKKILQRDRNCWKINAATETGLLVDARHYFRAFYNAARAAENYILISGWQFDSDIPLLYGADAEAAGESAHFLAFLNNLCEQNERLRIYILAWDFTALYSLDREWFQDWYFNWTTNERLKFSFDCCHTFAAAHHQKFVVIDGVVAFVGGLDLCSARWDERDHRAENPHRLKRDQTPYAPFHDIQSYHIGPVADGLAELFKTRWGMICGGPLDLPAATSNMRMTFEPTLKIAATEVAISRTQASQNGSQKGIQEIRQLFLDAIDAAERLIYIENQYFSSQALFNALQQRLKDDSRSKLDIVLVIAKDAEAMLEQLSIGVIQARLIRQLQSLAAETGHSLGIYYPASSEKDGNETATYIHSKLFLVDDRFLSVGSANMNNRSMGLDTELNVAWESASFEDALASSIREARVDLLAEHTGLNDDCERHNLSRSEGLVEYLNGLADRRLGRLRHHPIDSVADEYQWVTTVLPDGLPFDTEGPLYGENTYEDLSAAEDSFFTRGVTTLKNWLLSFGQAPERSREQE
jgi:phospholipase D1/2